MMTAGFQALMRARFLCMPTVSEPPKSSMSASSMRVRVRAARYADAVAPLPFGGNIERPSLPPPMSSTTSLRLLTAAADGMLGR